MSNNNSNHRKATFTTVTMPVLSVRRDDDGGEWTETIPGARIAVPFALDHADAASKAIAAHRETFEIPANIHIQPTIEDKALKVGTTVPSKSGQAKFHGKLVSA